MISHHQKCIFIHIPKAAGQSIEHVFLNMLGLTWETRAPLLLRENNKPELGPPRLAHLIARDYVRCHYLSQELFDEYYKFSFVRNPWDRMVSLYKYLGYDQKYDFKKFLTEEIGKNIWHERYWFVRPQSEFLYDTEGKLLVDFVGKFENIQVDFNQVCPHIGLPPTQVPHVNKSQKRKRGKGNWREKIFGNFGSRGMALTQPPAYKDYYDSESIEIVAELYNSDIKLLGYSFED